MSRWKNHLIVLTIAVLCVSFPVFLVTGYTALYWAWIRANLQAAVPCLPWARNFGTLAMVGAAAAFAILFSSRTLELSAKMRLWLSLLATATIGSFAEFRNEGKFYFKGLVHFFGPGTWIHDGLSGISSSLGDFLYRIEYSHLNDFLTGPAIVSVLFSLVFAKVYMAFRNQGPTSLTESGSNSSTDLDSSLRFARVLMNVGLFWFFIQAWAEKAGYLSNPYSRDEIDLPFEFAGTMVGFWMTRVLTKPFDQRSEKFRSTFLIDFVCSGVIGLLYTLVVGPLTEHVASNVAHALYPAVPGSLDAHQYTALQQHMRPFELLLLAGAMWWGLNRLTKHDKMTRLTETDEESEAQSKLDDLVAMVEAKLPEDAEPTSAVFAQREQKLGSKWDVPITMAKALAAITAYLLFVAMMLSVLEPQGLGWTLATAAAGMAGGTAVLLLLKRAGVGELTTVLGRNHDVPSD